MLCDSHNRVISYLRVSVTDRCNFRCTYCMPEENVDFANSAGLLTSEEIARVARVGAGLGLTKIRLTGGEPTVRRDLPRLVSLLADTRGIREVSMTTNASRLAGLAAELKRAGLSRVNISLDTLRRERMREITRRDVYEEVMRGVEEAARAGLTPLKFNSVVMRGVNDDELCDLAEFARERGAQVRFIEYMPMGALGNPAERAKVVTAREMLARLRERFDLAPAAGSSDPGDPARRYVCGRTGGRLGRAGVRPSGRRAPPGPRPHSSQ